jgi:hypothetical protein
MENEPPVKKKAHRRTWSIRNDGLSDWEKSEYQRTGIIRVKEPSVFSEDRSSWPFGCFRKIDIKEIIGGEELLTWNPDLELTVIARVYLTEFGIIGVEDQGSRYLLEVADRNRRSAVLNRLDWFGCRARAVPGGFIAVYRERLIYD